MHHRVLSAFFVNFLPNIYKIGVKTLIVKFFTSTITEDERISLRDWLKDSKNQEHFKDMVRTNRELNFAYSPIDVEKAYQRILNAIPKNDKSIQKHLQRVLKYAAVVAVLIGSSVGLYSLLKTDDIDNSDSVTKINPKITLELEDGSIHVLDENNQTSITDKEGHKVVNQEYDKLKYDNYNNYNNGGTTNELVYNKLTIPYGKRFEVELADGTLVYLNAGTKLRYPIAFTDIKSREVYLDGEALFNVKKNTSRPFIVHTEKMNIGVLGTKFNVSSYKNENNTSAVLVEGSIRVYSPSVSFDKEKSIVIYPRQQVVVQEGEFTVREVNVQKHIAWIEGKLYFVNDRFGDIIKELGRYYNIEIQNNYSELNNTRYTGTFESETIEQILNAFKRNTRFDYRKEDNKIIINPFLEK